MASSRGALCAAVIFASTARLVLSTDDSCGVLLVHDGGFTAVVNLVLLSMVVYPHKRFYIDDGKLSYKCWPERGNWNRIFSGKVQEVPESSTKNCTVHVLPDEPMHEMHRLLNDKVIEGHDSAFQKKGEALLKVWPLSERSKRFSDAHVNFLRSLPRPLTAVHVRQGDKVIEDHWRGEGQAVYGPVDFARAALAYPGARNGSCIVYGDDIAANHATAQQLLRLLKCYPIVIGGLNGGHLQSRFNSKDFSDRCNLVDGMVSELEGMAIADYFIGSMNSNIPRLVALMRVHLNQLDRSTARDVQGMQWHPW